MASCAYLTVIWTVSNSCDTGKCIIQNCFAQVQDISLYYIHDLQILHKEIYCKEQRLICNFCGFLRAGRGSANMNVIVP